MRALIQRTFKSALSVDGKLISEIPSGLTIFLGIEKGDTEEQADYFARKVAKLRVFRDENDKMNLDIKQAGGEILLVSQFFRLQERWARARATVPISAMRNFPTERDISMKG